MICWRSSHRARATLLAFVCFCAAVAFGQDDPWPGTIEDYFRRLKASIQKDEGPEEIYALLSTLSQRIIEVKKDGTATLHYDDGNGRTRDRAVPADKLARLRRWLSEKKVDELPPYDPNISDGIQYEYVHLDRKGKESRVPMNNPPKTVAAASSEFGGHNPRAYGALMQRLLALDEVKAPIVYRSLQHLPGFKLVYTGTDKEFVSALALRNGRLLAEVWPANKAKTWHAVTDSGIAAKRVIEPRNPLERPWWPKYLDGEYADATEGPYAGKRLWVGTRQKDGVEGLWASGVKGAPELIVPGKLFRPIICPGGEWVVARMTSDGPISSVRIHLPTRTIAPVELPAADDSIPLMWLTSHNRILLYQQRNENEGSKTGQKEREYFLLDPATGLCERVNGDFRPLTDYNNLPRRLQPSSEKDVDWAAVVNWKPGRPGEADTDIGKYNVHDFVFTPLLHLPGVHVDSDQMVVDEKAGEVWLLLCVSGDIAKVSLPNASGPK